MIVVKVEIWPGGNMAKSREIARGEIENRGEVNNLADYHVTWTEGGRTIAKNILNHLKTESILNLVKKSLP